MYGGPLLSELTKTAYERQIPLAVNLELTHKCNLRCSHCYIDFKSDVLSAKKWEEILKDLVKIETLVLTISGGDPLLHPEFEKIYKTAHQLGFGIRLFSNLLAFDDSKFELIQTYKPLNVQTSIYGHTEELHDSITHVKGSFSKTMKAAARLTGANTPVMLKTSWMQANFPYMVEIEQLAVDIGGYFQGSVRLMVARDGDDSNTSHRLTRDQLISMYSSDNEPKAGWSEPKDTSDSMDALIEKKDVKGLDYPCGAAIATMRIGPQGNVYPCVQYNKPAGNVLTESIEDIWKNSEWFTYLRSLKQSDAEECSQCHLSKHCFRCPADAYAETNNPLGCSSEAKLLAEAYESSLQHKRSFIRQLHR